NYHRNPGYPWIPCQADVRTDHRGIGVAWHSVVSAIGCGERSKPQRRSILKRTSNTMCDHPWRAGCVTVPLFHCLFHDSTSITHFLHDLDPALCRVLPHTYAVCIADNNG